MIVREVQFADGPPQWLLISQVEHARLSGELAKRCLTKFGDANPALGQVREELLQAIIHHDDGWAEWEAAPRFDPKSGKPLSFMELPLAEALDVWNGSIESANRFGDLAPWVVAGHFSALLCTIGSHSQEPAARDWLRHIAEKRSLWFTQWRARHEALHTVALAGEALKWLQLFDILSLWPCSQYPVPGEIIRKPPSHSSTSTIGCWSARFIRTLNSQVESTLASYSSPGRSTNSKSRSPPRPTSCRCGSTRVPRSCCQLACPLLRSGCWLLSDS
jgi:hypothetical protein